ncbi:MAG: Histidine--tRNA ligase [Methanomassiliicoccales archaeon PtaU1.Bin124]|nr:MAG: Histidine--tRNA ligase [Methanomassiliicoccales archaeon PtaU1.Bin124]
MIQRPRGTRDFTPEEMGARRYYESMMRSVAVSHGFREVQTPIFEHTELFTTKSGPGIVEEMYAFKDKGDREICLRPELTASVIRFFVNDLTNYPRPLKMFYFGQCFRYERPQAGRYREFFQFGAEIIGSATPEMDAEMIGLAAAILERTGLKDYKIRVGHIGVLKGMLAQAGVSGDTALPILQKLDKKMYEEAEPLMKAAGMSADSIEKIIATTKVTGPLSVLDTYGGEAGEYLKEVFAILAQFGFRNVEVDLGVVRGLAYYTGIVFEVDAPKLGAEKQICGGGSYSLSELFGGEKVFSTGFAIGFDRTLLAIEKEGQTAPKLLVDAYVIPVNDKTRMKAYEVAALLRRNGISCDLDIMRRNMGKNFKYADAIGARRTIIVGEKELESGCVNVRDMSSGEQKMVPIESLVQHLKG